MNEIICGDCIEELKKLEDNSVDSIVTDPPYELNFMGKGWDNTGIANSVELWGECLRVLKPGGYLLSFGGTRTYHRMACAIEDAGFEIRDMVEWLYGSGFPKSLNIGKAVDRLQGNEREEMVNERWAEKYPNGPGGNLNPEKYGQCKRIVGNPLLTSKGTSPWEGWGTALKPARFFYCAKASKEERNRGCEGLEEKKSELNSGGIGRECSVEKRLENGDGINASLMKNNHPTVKPIALMKYLIKLVTPPKGIVLDPFAGSGSTLVAAKELGFNFIGIDKEEEYVKIAEARIAATKEELKLL